MLWFGLFMRSKYIFNMKPLCLFLKYLQLDLKSIGLLRSARINESDVRGVCYLGTNDTHVASAIQYASDKRPKSAFG